LKPVSHGVNTRYANENFWIKYSKKTTSGRYFEILGTKFCNSLSFYFFNLPPLISKKCIEIVGTKRILIKIVVVSLISINV